VSKIAEHSWIEDHCIQWDKEEIIHKRENMMTRELKELVFIKTTEHVTSQPSLDVSSIWLPPL
jgi:hypothetical protein